MKYSDNFFDLQFTIDITPVFTDITKYLFSLFFNRLRYKKYYSFLRLSTGLAKTAFIVVKPTVTKVKSKVTNPAIIKVNRLISI